MDAAGITITKNNSILPSSFSFRPSKLIAYVLNLLGVNLINTEGGKEGEQGKETEEAMREEK